METQFRSDLIDWLRSDPALTSLVNSIEEESPVTASPPWIGIAASASADWGNKTARGREVRVALELLDRGDDADATAAIVDALEARIATIPAAQNGYRIVVTQFLRSRAEHRERSQRAVLVEYRFRILATP